MNVGYKPFKSYFKPDIKKNIQWLKAGFTGSVELHGKPVAVQLTAAAVAALNHLPDSQAGMNAEMELYFSCLIRKRVLFSRVDTRVQDTAQRKQVVPGLYISFNPVTTKVCRIPDNPNGPLTEAMPIREPGRFVPEWISIHYRSGQWKGEFGFKTHI